MKVKKIIAILAIVLSAHVAHAACTGQETTVVFINGVWTPEDEAIEHMEALQKESRNAGISSDCVHFDYSHTQDDTKQRDVVEALIQKSNELNIPLLTLVRAFFATITLDATMTLAIDDILVSGYQDTTTIIADQLDKHLLKFKGVTHIDDPDPTKRHRGIALTHSQGGLYGNAMWNGLNLIERGNTRLVTVSNPSSGALDGGPNTRLSRDGVANRFFLAASLEGFIPNVDRPCDTEAETVPNSWPCHGFETGYLHDTEARTQIVSDIKEALPHATILGTVRDFTGGTSFVSGATVSLFSSTTLIAETLADTEGRYRFDNVPAPCPACFVKAKSADIAVCGTTATPVIDGEVRVADITLAGSCDTPPPTVIFSQPDSSETITGWDGTRRFVFENMDSFTGTAQSITLRLKSTKGTDTTCSYPTRVNVTVFSDITISTTGYSVEQDITDSYADYTFDISAANLPLAHGRTFPFTGLSFLYITPVASPINACFNSALFPPDIAGVNRDVIPYVSPRLNSFESFPADPYIVVVGR